MGTIPLGENPFGVISLKPKRRSEGSTLGPETITQVVLKVATDDDCEQPTVASIASHELLCFDMLSTSN
jgi:hypothetical protein